MLELQETVLMTKQKLHIISFQEEYLVLAKQLNEIFGDRVQIFSTTIKDLRHNMVQSGDLVVLSHNQMRGLVAHFLPDDCSYIVAKRDINYMNTKGLIDFPDGQKILVVNDTQINTEETVVSLTETYFEHSYISYNPMKPFPNGIDYIITPGEEHLLPNGLSKVMDIGIRVVDIETVIEISELLKLDIEMTVLLKRYIKSLVPFSKGYSPYDPKNKKKIVKDISNKAIYQFSDIVTESIKMKETVTLAQKFAPLNQPIFIEGEVGTGKKMVAQAIHNESFYRKGSFVVLHCSSKSEDVLKKELFGIEEKGSITIGLLEMADNGTLYIDEVSELPLSIQKDLFQVINTKEMVRMVGGETIPINVRVIISNTKPLESFVKKKSILQELYYLVAPFSIVMPLLVERKEDFEYLIDYIKKRLHREELLISTAALRLLKKYSWTGNVKELYNVISYLACLGKDKIDVDSLPLYIRPQKEMLDKIKDAHLDIEAIVAKIEEHGFLDESIRILSVFAEGKKELTSFGRQILKKRLEEHGLFLSEQQLRARMEVLQELGLLNVRLGRAGTTISRLGEMFLQVSQE